MEGLEQKLKEQFGVEEIERTKKELDLYFNNYPTDIMEYLKLLQILISELTEKNEDWSGRLESYWCQESFISANNFYGPDQNPRIAYDTRLMYTLVQLFSDVDTS